MTVTVEAAVRHEVEVRYDVAVPMPDGVNLRGNLYLPATPGTYPAIMTLNPYHKDGRGGMSRADAHYRHFAARGYGVLGLDMRGTGSSEGTPYRTMDGRERQDGHQAVEWLAAQPWCTGDVGVWGTSYGGITAMAIAETRPPHLRAIVPVHAPDDNYEAMMVHRGSRLMFWPDPHWGANMAASNLMPPLRYDGTGRWLQTWQQRLDAEPWIFDWHGEPPDAGYWARQRIDPSRIEVPTLCICGWQDAYPDGMALVYRAVTGPKRLIYGPWKHAFPEQAIREPVGILAEIDRWWDRWLKGVDNSVDAGPPVAIFVQGTEQWRHEQEWPPARAEVRRLYPRPGGALADAPAPAGSQEEYVYDARAGVAGLAYDACTGPIPYPQDQSADDHLSRCYTTAPLAEPLEVTGDGRVTLYFSTDAPLDQINLVAKLVDVAPDGHSYLAARDNLHAPRAEAVGDAAGRAVYRASFPLRPTAYVFRAGHRLRLAVSGADFPFLWPTPHQYRLTLHQAAPWATELELPVVGPPETTLPEVRFEPPRDVKPAAALDAAESYAVHRELVSRAVTVEGRRWGKVQVEPGATLAVRQEFTMSVDADHPEAANSRTTADWRLDRPTGAVHVHVETTVTLHDVAVDATIDLDGHPYYRRQWRKPR